MIQDSRLQILLIEDNESDIRLIKEYLFDVSQAKPTRFTFQLDTAVTLEEGLEKLSVKDYTILLLDLTLPDSKGFETFVAAQQANPRIPIIVLSGLDDEELAVQSVRTGAQDYLSKNEVTGYLLIRAIRYAIERKREEETLRAVNKRLKDLDRMKSDFLSTVSHELRTPIAIMKEGVSLCLDGILGDVNERQEEILKATLENIDRLTHLVTDLLDVSKIEAGRIKLKRSHIDLKQLVLDEQQSFMEQAKGKRIDLSVSVPDGPLMIDADPAKLHQVFNNLLSNALRFTEESGKIEVAVENNHDHVLCKVTDNGIGIAKENLSLLFSKFEQFGRKDGPGYRGTGLGLVIVKGLIEKHKGKIWVDSEPGRGTTMTFTLPKNPLPKILIIDDEIQVANAIREMLNCDSYQFIVATDGKTGIEKAALESPELILLDMELPYMNGYEIIGRLKQDECTQKIPIVIITAYAVDESKLGSSVFPVLNKPFEIQDLKKCVREKISCEDEPVP